MLKELEGKNILLIAPSFFSYDRAISQKLQDWGANVFLYDDRPSNSAIIKGIIRFKKSLIQPVIHNYYKKIIRNSKNIEFDFIFFIKGESITTQILKELKERYSKAKFVLYLWDSISNNPNKRVYSYFDRVLTFDKDDFDANPGFQFRPLFYLDSYRKIGESGNIVHKYDLSFVGTVHSDRYNVIKKILENFEGEKINLKIIMYLHGKLLFWFRKITEKGFRNVPKSEICFIPIPFEKVNQYFLESNTIIDIHHPLQTGLTMRTLEVLGAKKKLITTNPTIKQYDFYNEKNICLIDRTNPKVSVDFIKNKFEEIPHDIYEKYSIESWIKECLFNFDSN